ncbi:hypothetical protein ACFFRR_010968 [Megaselia abdita]
MICKKSVFFVKMLRLLVFFVAPVLSFNKLIPYSELLKCKEYQGPADYKYEQFFDIMKFENNKPSNGEVFRIKLYVLTTKDVWMLLTPSANLTSEAHEIGLDHVNAYIQTPYYHYGDKRDILKSQSESPRINLHSLFPLEIVIKYTYGGTLSLVLPEYSTSKPYVSRQYDNYTPCPYLSLSSGPSQGEARWFYDCPLGEQSIFVN